MLVSTTCSTSHRTESANQRDDETGVVHVTPRCKLASWPDEYLRSPAPLTCEAGIQPWCAPSVASSPPLDDVARHKLRHRWESSPEEAWPMPSLAKRRLLDSPKHPGILDREDAFWLTLSCLSHDAPHAAHATQSKPLSTIARNARVRARQAQLSLGALRPL